MKVELPAGKYVVAVSGGVDSVVLLRLLVEQLSVASNQRQALDSTNPLRLIVAHFDHGIRPDSAEDRKLVQKLAADYGLPFVYGNGRLGASTSEAAARSARYTFLRQVQAASGAQAIVTAHHQDDVLETAILNMVRGTGRKGLTALSNTPGLLRPLLAMTKQELRTYAMQQSLQWREDSTNSDDKYLRNYVRHSVVPKFTSEQRNTLLQIITNLRTTNQEIDRIGLNLLHVQPAIRQLDRSWFIQLPHSVAREVLAMWLRVRGINQFDARMLERLTVAAKTGRPGTHVDVMQGATMKIEKKHLALEVRER